MPSVDRVQTHPDLVNLTPTVTPMTFSMPHRFAPFHLTRLRAPRISLMVPFFLHANRRSHSRAAPPPLLRPRSAAAAPLRRRSHAPPPQNLCFAATPPCCTLIVPTRSTAAPTTRPRHPRATTHPLRHRSPSPPARLLLSMRAVSPAPHPHAFIRARFEFPPPLVRVHARCSRNGLLGFFFDFFSTDSRISKGMVLPLLACDVSSCSYLLHTCLHGQ
jgi:hypothetical protein